MLASVEGGPVWGAGKRCGRRRHVRQADRGARLRAVADGTYVLQVRRRDSHARRLLKPYFLVAPRRSRGRRHCQLACAHTLPQDRGGGRSAAVRAVDNAVPCRPMNELLGADVVSAVAGVAGEGKVRLALYGLLAEGAEVFVTRWPPS